MEFRILGPLEVLHEGHALALGGSKQRALLALLLLHANETLSTDRLIDELWGERPPATAAKTVQVHISRLRKALAGEPGTGSAGILLTRERGYELSVDPERLDAHRFERLVAEGRSELADGRPERAASAFEDALSLWRGAPLPELAYEPFAQREVARLEDLRVAAHEQLMEARLALGMHAEVVGQLEALIGEHPYRERLRAQLMLALYRSDRQADALQAFQDARRTLVEELGIEPGSRLRELEGAILAQDPGLNISIEEPAVEPALATPRGTFVGRERELAELIGGLDDAFAGRGRLFLLAGEPGIGKSRLADELTAYARTRGAALVAGRCWEEGGAPAYWPWVQSLRGYVRDSDDAELRRQLDDVGADLVHLLPELRQRFPDLPDRPGLEPEGARFRLFEGVSMFLRRASRARPLVLVLDDMHAADEPSLLLLRFVAREMADSRLLLVCAFRDVDPSVRDPLSLAIAELVREPQTAHLELTGLTDLEVAKYVELAVGAEPAGGLVQAIHASTEGNPLFVAEAVRLLHAEGRITDPEARVHIPPGVRAVIRQRTARLTERCRSVLGSASVLGREFSVEALARLSELGPDMLLDTLDEAVAERIVVEVPGSPGRRRFAHALIRDTLYHELTAARRQRLHQQAGEALEAIYSADPEPHLAELAHHFFFASGTETAGKALAYARHAGDRAARELAYEEAVRLYGMALDRADLEREPRQVAALLERLHRVQWELNRQDESVATLNRALALLDPDEATRERAALLAAKARARMLQGRHDEAVRVGREALAMARLIEDHEVETRALTALGPSLSSTGNVDAGAAALREALEIARAHDLPDELGRAFLNLADLFLLRGRTDEALRVARRGLEELAEGGRGQHGDWLRLLIAEGEFERGNWEAAAGTIPSQERRHVGSTLLFRCLRLAELHLGVGDEDAARRELDVAARAARVSTEPQFVGPLAAARAELERRAGNTEPARQAVDEALDRIEYRSDLARIAQVASAGVRVEADAAERARDRRDAAAEAEALDRARRLAERVRPASVLDGPAERPLVAATEAELARAKGRAAPHLWTVATAAWDAAGRPYQAAYAGLRESEALVAAGDRDAASRAAATARKRARRLGSHWLLAELDSLAARARLRLDLAAAPEVGADAPTRW
jgi:DNA-binding SARP family transcriptional activator/tetratricopeptide (TPR) repeat protein